MIRLSERSMKSANSCASADAPPEANKQSKWKRDGQREKANQKTSSKKSDGRFARQKPPTAEKREKEGEEEERKPSNKRDRSHGAPDYR